MIKQAPFLATAITLIAGASLSQASVTYVDATTSNTTLADGTAMVDGSVGYITNTSAADGLWNLRPFGNGGTIFEAGASGSEDAARLATTISLTVGETYEIYAYFWGAGSGALWRGRTSLTDDAGDLQGYNTNHFDGSSFDAMSFVTKHDNGGENPGPLSTATGGIEDGGYFSNSVMTEESDRNLYQVSLGQVVVDGSGLVTVYIDDLVTSDQANRTWYDGVGYALVPEPSVALLGGLGLIGLLRRRRD